MRWRFAAILVLFIFTGVAPSLAHQPASTTSGLAGRVADVTGGALPGATVTVTRMSARAHPQMTVTGADGHYAFPDLPPGSYQVTVELSGFKTVRETDVTIEASGRRELNVVLDVGGLTESVTVLGQRTPRSLRDTSASVAVYDQAALESQPGAQEVSGLLSVVPNMISDTGTNLAPAVRGADGTGPAQGADAFFAGSRARLNFQIDGRPASYNEVTFGDVALWDVQQVEVFRGPQSALQGRNAVAGTISVRTNDPTYHPEAKLRVIGGNQRNRQISGVLSGPIIANQLAYRISFDDQTTDSYVRFAPYATPTGQVDHPGRFEDLTIRGKLRIDPKALDGFSTLVTVSHASHTGPQTDTVAQPYDEHDASFPAMPVFQPTTTGVVAESSWRTSDRLAFEDTLSVTSLNVTREATPGDGNATIDAREIVFEPRVHFGLPETGIRGFGGVYLFHANQDEAIDLFGGGTFADHTMTAALFGEVTLPAGPRLDLTLGGRLEREHHRRLGADGPFSIDFDETYHVFSPKVDLAWHATPASTIGVAVSRGYNGGGAGFTYDPPFVSYTYEPEFVWTYEGYTRTDLHGGRVSVTGNVFYSRYHDMQLPFNLSPDPNVWSFVVRNADAAMTYGAEGGVEWTPAPGAEVYANVGLLKTRITNDPGSGIEDHELPRSPAFTSSFGGRYQHGSGIDLSLSARFTDAYYSSVINEPRGRTDPYAVADAQIGYTRSHTRIFLFANNLFNGGYAVLISPGATPADDTANILRPRRIGVGLTLSR
jgi:outer membrane receptor protein involved in Fe transport